MQETPIYHAVTLVVTNSERLEGRSLGSYVFRAEGGTLGSHANDSWLLQSPGGRVHPAHAEIRLLDGRFCLIDRSGHTFINDATLPIGRDRCVALRDCDELGIGDYRLRVHHGDRQAMQPGNHPLDVLIDEEGETLQGGDLPVPHAAAIRHDDPLAALGEAIPGIAQRDPLTALDPCDTAAASDTAPTDTPAPGAVYGAGDDLQDRRHTAMRLPAITRRHEECDMDERLLDDLERSVGERLEERWQEPATVPTGHVGADPLLRTLGGELDFRDSAEQHAFLEEAGRTLRATIDGLLNLHQSQDGTRYPLRDRRLQPIEDNPLRLEQSYADTVATLFSARRSPVHLSAPAAVGECLEHQRQHQAATEEAIGQALTAILDAFAPEALLKRFHAYRRVSHLPDEEDGWAWEMYRHYYQELNSDRQRGFEKLFWEVFDQAYDGSLRRRQREEA